MKRTKINAKIEEYPSRFHALLNSADLYDSSCSPQARVLFIDKDSGYYLKQSKKGSLEQEAVMSQYLFKNGLGTEVLDYYSDHDDWLLTRRMSGEDCTHSDYLADPNRLCDLLAQQLYLLHSLDPTDCPIRHTEKYLKTAEENYKRNLFDPSYSLLTFNNAKAAWMFIQRNKHLLQTDTLIHGDYCLPNIMLNQWSFSGFIDVGNGGVGDRHIDLFWGAWSLSFNLKTDRYRERFFEAYGKEHIHQELIDLISVIEAFG